MSNERRVMSINSRRAAERCVRRVEARVHSRDRASYKDKIVGIKFEAQLTKLNTKLIIHKTNL